MIQTDKTTVFLNLPEDGATEELYEELKAKSGSLDVMAQSILPSRDIII